MFQLFYIFAWQITHRAMLIQLGSSSARSVMQTWCPCYKQKLAKPAFLGTEE